MEQEKLTIDDLAESIRVMKDEVRVLQVTTRSQKATWYKNISTWISILALLLSFGVAYFSYLRAKAQDIQNTRVELRTLLQRLSALSKEYFEVPYKYQHDPNAIGSVQSSIAQESAVLSRHAAELA